MQYPSYSHMPWSHTARIIEVLLYLNMQAVQQTLTNVELPAYLHHGAFIAVIIPYVASFIIFTVMICSFIFGAVVPWPHYCDDLHAVSHNSTMAHCQFTVLPVPCAHIFLWVDYSRKLLTAKYPILTNPTPPPQFTLIHLCYYYK